MTYLKTFGAIVSQFKSTRCLSRRQKQISLIFLEKQFAEDSSAEQLTNTYWTSLNRQGCAGKISNCFNNKTSYSFEGWLEINSIICETLVLPQIPFSGLPLTERTAARRPSEHSAR